MGKTTILKEHLEFKKTSVSSVEKIKDIERYVGKFLNSTSKPVDKFKEEDVTKFINSLDYAIGTINGIKAYLKVFIKWHYDDWSSRFRNLDRICKQQKTERAYKPDQMITLEEIKKLIEGERDLMYKVYWTCFFHGGFRPSECCRLEWNQIFFEDEGVIIKMVATKTKKDFYKSLPREAEHLLKEWKNYNHSNYIFPSPLKEDFPILARSICARLKRLSKRVLNKEVVPYALRHSIATIMYADDNRNDDDVANQLGHNKSMKQVYLNLDEGALKSRARKLWIKPKKLTPEEKDELKTLRKDMGDLKEMQLKANDIIFTLADILKDSKNMNKEERLKVLDLLAKHI